MAADRGETLSDKPNQLISTISSSTDGTTVRTNGVDVTRVHEGKLLDLSPRDAGLLLAAEWAVPAEPEQKTEGAGMVRISEPDRACAKVAERPRRRRRTQI